MFVKNFIKLYKRGNALSLEIVSPDVYCVVAPASPDVIWDWPYEAATLMMLTSVHTISTNTDWKVPQHRSCATISSHQTRDSRKQERRCPGERLSSLYSLLSLFFSPPSHLSQIVWLTMWPIHRPCSLSMTLG